MSSELTALSSETGGATPDPRDDASPEVSVTADDYGAYYYDTYNGSPYDPEIPKWREFFGGVADAVVTLLQPTTALDAGCAMGVLVGSLRERGVDAEGVDLSDYAIAHGDPRAEGHLRVGSLTEPFGKRYDLVTCIEVLEHLPEDAVVRAVANICAASDTVLVSSTPDDFNEASHINVHQPAHWAALFADHGFFRRFDVDGSFLSGVAVVYERRDLPVRRMVWEYETQLWTLRRENIGTRAAVIVRDRRCAELEHERKLAALGSPDSRERLAAVEAERDAALRRVNALTSSKRYRVGSALAAPLKLFRRKG
jgi:SAM-dependent methyltransferase